MSVATELLYPALRLAGILGAPGRTASTSELADAFDALNRMLGSWTIQDELIYGIQANRYNLSPSKVSYTIGPTGADCIAPRPIRITHATLVLLGPSELHLPLNPAHRCAVGARATARGPVIRADRLVQRWRVPEFQAVPVGLPVSRQ
jgi:hypothetical protein